MEFIIISGMSGAGKSSAAAFLEDLGFYCVDNLPVALIPSFAGICLAGAGTGKYSRVALVTDIRGGQTFDELFQTLDSLKEMNLVYQLLYIEASDASGSSAERSDICFLESDSLAVGSGNDDLCFAVCRFDLDKLIIFIELDCDLAVAVDILEFFN